MNGKAFLDTNVVVYAHDAGSPAKRARAGAIIAAERDRLVLSPQVMVEFYSTATRKLPIPLSERDAEAAIRDLSALASIVVPDRNMVLEATTLSRKDRLSIWDALIVQCAIVGRCSRLLSEDMQHGRRFGDLVIENPFQDL